MVINWKKNLIFNCIRGLQLSREKAVEDVKLCVRFCFLVGFPDQSKSRQNPTKMQNRTPDLTSFTICATDSEKTGEWFFYCYTSIETSDDYLSTHVLFFRILLSSAICGRFLYSHFNMSLTYSTSVEHQFEVMPLGLTLKRE